jgi:hypothetical protein
MRRRLTPTAAGAKSSPLCFRYHNGSLNLQLGYCP